MNANASGKSETLLFYKNGLGRAERGNVKSATQEKHIKEMVMSVITDSGSSIKQENSMCACRKAVCFHLNFNE